MIYNSNKKILLILVIIIILVIISIITYLLYRIFNTDKNIKNIKNIKNNENFDTLDTNNYVPINIGDPLSNNLSDDIIMKAQNTIYNLESNLQVIKLISNGAGTTLMAACNDSSNGNNLAICILPTTSNKWECLAFDSGANRNLTAFNKLNPSTTLPEMNNNISCSKDSSILITNNSKTLFIYNEPYNLLKRLNCLYYSSISRSSNTMNLNCLALPSLNVPSTTSSNGLRAPLSYSYDKMNFICANDRFLLGLSCSNVLYYFMLNTTNTASPDENSSWKPLNVSISSIPNFNLKNIIYLGVNDIAIFLYYNDYTNPATLLYSPLHMSDGVLTISLAVLPINENTPSTPSTPSTTASNTITPNFYSNGFAINNDVIFGLEKPDKSGNMNLWWCFLNTNIPIWKTMNLSNQGIANIPFNNLTAIYIYNNSLIINYYTGKQNNLVIPLLSNSSNPSNPINSVSTTTSNNTNAITTSANTTTTMANVSNGTTTPHITSILPMNDSNNATILNTTPDNTLYNSLLTNTPVLGNTPGLDNTLLSNTPGLGNTLLSNTPVLGNTLLTNTPVLDNTTPNNTLRILNPKPLIKNYDVNWGSPASLMNGLSTAAQNGIRTDVGVNGVIGNLGNKDNINDFMKDANLLGNNIYVSPMNNDQLYNPRAKLSQLGKITSSFFPMIKIA